LLAVTPEVSIEFSQDATPTLVGQISLSQDDVTYSDTLTLSDLAPWEISPVLYLRCDLDLTAALGLWAFRVVASPSAMT
jgi:hypothetical protein